MQIYSAYQEPVRLPQPLRWWVDFTQGLVSKTAHLVWISEWILFQTVRLFWRQFTCATVNGWAIVSLLLVHSASKWNVMVDHLHMSLGISPFSLVRRPAFCWVDELNETVEQLPKHGKTEYAMAFATLIALFSVVLAVVALPYWLVRRPLADQADPMVRIVRLSWSIITLALAYALMYIVVPAMLLMQLAVR
jgi:hypothetical protein